MARYACPRCNIMCNTLDPPHVCVDIRRRLKRREGQVAAVMSLLGNADSVRYPDQFLAEEIVQKLNELGVTDD